MGAMRWFLFFAVLSLCSALCGQAKVSLGQTQLSDVQRAQVSDDDIVIRGFVKDAATRRPLPYANVFVPGSNTGTVTNEEGYFVIKISTGVSKGIVGSLKSSSSSAASSTSSAAEAAAMSGSVPSISLEFSSLGYASVRLDSLVSNAEGKPLTVMLKPSSNLLSEVKVFGGDARSLVLAALARVGENYPEETQMLNLFYRETIKKGSRYVGISEGILDLYKTGYGVRRIGKDRVKVERSRKILNQRASDTLAVKIQGGPLLAVEFDLVKNPDALFDEHTIHWYSYTHERYAMLEGRTQYVVSFKPANIVDYPLYEGLLYIDAESLTLSRAEISMDISDRTKAERALLMKKPAGLRFRTLEASLVVSYRRRGERSCLDYIKSNIRFRCEWKRKLFVSSYNAISEMVVVDVERNPESNIPVSETFGKSQIFDDKALANWNRDFWKDYNIIEPTESLERAVAKLIRIYKR